MLDFKFIIYLFKIFYTVFFCFLYNWIRWQQSTPDSGYITMLIELCEEKHHWLTLWNNIVVLGDVSSECHAFLWNDTVTSTFQNCVLEICHY